METNTSPYKIDIFVLDVDGCLTDGKLHYTSDGKVMKSFCARDSDAIRRLKEVGIDVLVISADKSGENINTARMRDMQVEYRHVPSVDREALVKSFIDEGKGVAMMSDAIDDYKAFVISTLAIAPANGHMGLMDESHYVCHKKGGEQAVEEACEFIALSTGLIDQFYEKLI